MNFLARQKKLRQQLASCRLDALLVSHLPNVRYLCGFTGSAGALLLGPKGRVLFFTDGRYRAQAQAEVQEAQIVIAGKAPSVAAGEWLMSHRRGWARTLRRVGAEVEYSSVAAYQRLAAIMPDFRLRPALSLVEQARLVKDKEEIERLRAAAILGARLFERALAVIRPGIRET